MPDDKFLYSQIREFDQFKLCAVCVDGLGYVYVRECHVVLEECVEPTSLLVFSVCVHGAVD